MAKTPSYGLRLDPELRDRYARRAKEDGRTLASMLVKALTERDRQLLAEEKKKKGVRYEDDV